MLVVVVMVVAVVVVVVVVVGGGGGGGEQSLAFRSKHHQSCHSRGLLRCSRTLATLLPGAHATVPHAANAERTAAAENATKTCF